jgi:hypothetical protein
MLQLEFQYISLILPWCVVRSDWMSSEFLWTWMLFWYASDRIVGGRYVDVAVSTVKLAVFWGLTHSSIFIPVDQF